MSFNLRQIKTNPKSLEFSNWGTSTRHRNWLLWRKMEQHNIFLINKASHDAFHSNEYICHTKILLSIANDTCTHIHVTWFLFGFESKFRGGADPPRILRHVRRPQGTVVDTVMCAAAAWMTTPKKYIFLDHWSY